jgi:hypothetical protein
MEDCMTQYSLISQQRRRQLKPPFAWIDRRFIFHGFFAELTPSELLLYFFLILVADGDGLSFYHYDKICQHLKMDVDTYIESRNGLIKKNLIAFESPVFQVLSLPDRKFHIQSKQHSLASISKQDDFQSIFNIFTHLKKLNNQ